MTWLEPAAGDLLAYGSATALRATAVLIGALTLSFLLRRASAAARHALWTVTLGALVALPFLPALIPAVAVPLPWTSPAGPALEVAGTMSGAEGRPDGTGVVPPAGLPGGGEPIEGATAGSPAVAEGIPPGPAPGPGRDAGSGPAHGGSVQGANPAAFLLVWLAVASVLAGFLGMGLWRASRLVRGAARPRGEHWERTLDRARRAVGLRRRVSVGLSPGVRTALAGGLFRPVVLLPETARAWCSERREIVLLHELVHVKRGDPLRHLLARVALSLYWFHPLAWLAVRAATLAREQACDEAVLASGHRPSDYARHLMELAEPDTFPMPAVSRIDRPPLEKRIMAILRPRSPGRPGTVVAAALVGAAWALAVAAAAPANPPAPANAEAVSEPGEVASGVVSARFQAVPAPPEDIPAPPEVASAPPELAADPVDPLPPSLVGWAIDVRRDPRQGCRPREDGPDFEDGRDFGDRGWARGDRGWARGDRFIQTSLDGFMLCMRTHGEVALEDGRARIRSMPDGSWMVLALRGEGVRQRLEIVPARGALEHSWFVDGTPRPFDEQAREWRDAMLEVLGSHVEIASVRGEVGRLRGEIGRTRGEEARLRGEIARIRGELASQRGEMAGTRGEEARLRGEIARIRGEEARLRGEIARTRGEEARRRGEVSRLRARMGALEAAGRITEDDETRARLDAEAEAIGARVQEAEDRIPVDTERAVAEVGRRLEAHRRLSAARIAEIEAAIRESQVGRPEAAAELEARERDAEARIAEIEERIAGLGTDAEVREIRERIDELDADRRIRAIEERREAAAERLRALIREIR